MKNQKIWYVVIALIVFFAGAGCMYGIMYLNPAVVTQNVTKLEKDVTVTDTGIADAVEKVYDAVVVVNTYKNDTLSASGTGFIYEKKDNIYYLLTNYHVIEGGNKVKVTLTNDEIIETKIVGVNEYADIAVLSFESKNEYPVVEIGKSEDLRVGDTSFAVGAPLDANYSWTVTRGIISGKNRLVEVSDNVVNVLQTDTSINSGNSGGPLCNSNGEVIGINSLKLVSSGVEGMGFAIPIEDAVETAEGIISGNPKANPYIGISMANVSEIINPTSMDALRLYYEFADNIEKAKITTGVAITSVEENSAAEKAGIKKGDIIFKINDTEISSRAYLRYNLYKYNIGDTVKIKLYRDGEEKEVEVKLGKKTEETS